MLVAVRVVVRGAVVACAAVRDVAVVAVRRRAVLVRVLLLLLCGLSHQTSP